MKLRRASLQFRLILVGTATSLFTMALGSVAIVSYELHSRRVQTVADYTALASVLADSGAASVIFDDDDSAEELLVTLRARPTVTYSAILRQDGAIFADYSSGEGRALSPADMLSREPGYGLGDTHAYFSAPIEWDDETVGYLVLELSLAEFHADLMNLAATAALILVLSVVVAVAISSLLHRVTIRPLQHLESVARSVEVYEDYSIRATKETEDEVGFLTDAFNAMLAKIESRDAELHDASVIQELEIESRTRRLREEIAERKKIQRNIEQAREAAESGSRAKSSFLANMSHEIRTPMNGIVGMSELLGRTSLDGEQDRYVRVIQSCSEALLFLINDILDFSKIEAGKMQLERVPFDLREEVEEVAAMVAPKAHDKGVELACRIEVGIDRLLVGDPGRFRQVLTNLAGNAVKFTDAGFILIDVSSMRTAPGRVTVKCSVQDTGLGISPGQQKDIFEMFQQADGSTTRRFGGTGLGLTISRQLVEMMDGTFDVESMEGEGSTFTFTVKMAAQEKPLPLPKEADGIQGRRILVVDDNEINRLVVAELMSFWGCHVGECCDGVATMEELVRAYESGEPYDVVLLDNKMPGLKGTEVCQRVREDRRLDKVGLILLASLEVQEPGLRTWDAQLNKPVRQSELLRTMARLLGVRVTGDRGRDKGPVIRGDGYKVLVVEDNLVNQELAVELLRQAGFSVEVAMDGLEAVQAVPGGGFDVVLMDCQMPRMDGFGATAAIRQEPSQAGKVPIIALTAHARKEDRDKCLNAGMDDYLAKPLNAKELVGKVLAWAQAGKVKKPEGVTATLPESTERPVDYDEALERCGNNRALLQRLIAKFREQLQRDVPELARLIGDKKWPEATGLAHKMKGAAANLSAAAVREGARMVEMALRESDETALGEGMSLLEGAAASFCEEIGSNAAPAAEQMGGSGS